MTVRHAVLVLAVGAAATLVGSGPALAAPTPCPPSFLAVDQQDLTAQLVLADAPPEAFAGLPAVVLRTDRNGNGTLCQQIGSFGRAPGQPFFFSNFRDDRRV